MASIASDGFSASYKDQRCIGDKDYRVYLIDNFEQNFHMVPEVRTSHGEMVARLLKSGRNDIDLRILNTSLSKGLAQVIQDLMDGACVDAVVSSIPGSNYTFDQISSLLCSRTQINSGNILYYRGWLIRLMRTIAFNGFPSVEWLEQVDVNTVKLRNDAKRFAFIEALSQFNVPVILPYGNRDSTYRGKIKSVNLLCLASNAKVFNGLDQKGRRVPGFPYSPLSSGDEPAIYTILECPHPEDPLKACLDINNDGCFEYTFVRTGKIPYHDDHGRLSFAPSVLTQAGFEALKAKTEDDPALQITEEIVWTADQYRELKRGVHFDPDLEGIKSYVWLNAPKQGLFYTFEAQCWESGTLSGTSLIPPNKVKELLPPKGMEPGYLNP